MTFNEEMRKLRVAPSMAMDSLKRMHGKNDGVARSHVERKHIQSNPQDMMTLAKKRTISLSAPRRAPRNLMLCRGR